MFVADVVQDVDYDVLMKVDELKSQDTGNKGNVVFHSISNYGIRVVPVAMCSMYWAWLSIVMATPCSYKLSLKVLPVTRSIQAVFLMK